MCGKQSGFITLLNSGVKKCEFHHVLHVGNRRNWRLRDIEYSMRVFRVAARAEETAK